MLLGWFFSVMHIVRSIYRDSIHSANYYANSFEFCAEKISRL